MTTDDLTSGIRALHPADYREVMGHYPTGVAVVTGTSPEGDPVGMVVGTFTAVSLDPPLVAFMPTTTSGTYALMKDSPSFCVNVLAHDQLELCRLMAVPRPGKFDEVAWHPSPLGAPALDDAVAHVHCRLHEEVEAGDHLIVLCAVEQMEVSRPVTPLLFFQGGYGGFNPRGMTAQGDGGLIAAVRLAEVARPHIERLARTIGCELSVLVAVDDDEVTTALSAFGGGAEMQESLGARIPLMPPLGEAYVAFQPPEVGEQWVARSSSGDEEVRARYRRRLADVRDRGYAISVVLADSPFTYEDVRAAMREYASGGLTPARERAVRSVLSQAAPFFETVDIDDAQTYGLGSVVVPVLGPDGNAVMVLRARQLPQDVPGAVARQWVEAMRSAAASVADQLGRGSHARYEAYLDAFPGDYMM